MDNKRGKKRIYFTFCNFITRTKKVIFELMNNHPLTFRTIVDYKEDLELDAARLINSPEEVQTAFRIFENHLNPTQKQNILLRAKCIFETSKRAFDSDFTFKTPEAKEAFYQMDPSVQRFMILQGLVEKSGVKFERDVMIVPIEEDGGHNYNLHFPHLYFADDTFIRWGSRTRGNHINNSHYIMRVPLLEEVIAYLTMDKRIDN